MNRHHFTDSSRSSSASFRTVRRLPRFEPGANRHRGDWTPATKLTLFLLVCLILAIALLYRVVTAPERPASPPAPAGDAPRVQFQNAVPAERLDPGMSA